MTNTLLPAGSGRRDGLTLKKLFRFFCCCLCWLLPAASYPAADTVWQTAANYSVNPNSAGVLLLTQNGPDLLVRVETEAGTSFVQDSADRRLGTEVIYLDNPASVPRTFTIAVRPRFNGLPAEYSLQYFDDLSPAEQGIARRLSEAARLQLENGSTEAVLTLLSSYPEAAQSDLLYPVAFMQYLQGMYEAANTAQVVNLIQTTPIPENFPTTYHYNLLWLKAMTLWQTDRLDEALVAFQELDLFLGANPVESATGRILDLEHISAHHGATLVSLGRRDGNHDLMQQGVDLIDAALAEAASYEDYNLLGELNNYVSGYSGMLFNRIDEGGIKALELAEQFFTLAGDDLNLAGIKNNQAFYLLGLGDVGAAQQKYREALQLMADVDVSITRIFVIARLASTYLITGDYVRAETLFNDAISMQVQLNRVKDAANNQIELAITLRLQNKYQQAVDVLQDALSNMVDDSWLEELMRIQTELAHNHIASQDMVSARDAAALAVQYRTPVARLNYRLDVSLLLAELAILDGNVERAMNELESALAELESPLHESEHQMQILSLLSRCYFETGQPQMALDYGARAVGIIASVRNQLDIRIQGPTWTAKTNEIQSLYISYLFEEYLRTSESTYLERGFEQAQYSRTISLRQTRLQNQSGNYASDSAQLRRLWDAMMRDKRRVLSASLLDEPLQVLQEQALRSEEEYRVYEVAATPASLDTTVEVLSLEQVQAALQERELATFYHVDTAAAYRLDISRNAIQLNRLQGKNQLDSLIQDYIADIHATADDLQSQPLLSILPPVASLLSDYDTLYVDSHDVLNILPFSALMQSDSDYLIEDIALVNTISLSEYFSGLSREVSGEGRLGIAVIADPVFSSDIQSLPAESENFSRWQSSLARLPFTTIEANNILQYFPAESSVLYTGEIATFENTVLDAVRDSRILHIATHGFADDENPALTGMALAGNSTDIFSGLLTPEDIHAYSFTNELVVISGCETGQGLQLAGEGILSLARSFIGSGAKSVIATLWPVSDRATATFMDNFYGFLSDGFTTQEALRATQDSFLTHPLYSHPFYWSGFTLTAADNSARPM